MATTIESLIETWNVLSKNYTHTKRAWEKDTRNREAYKRMCVILDARAKLRVRLLAQTINPDKDKRCDP